MKGGWITLASLLALWAMGCLHGEPPDREAPGLDAEGCPLPAAGMAVPSLEPDEADQMLCRGLSEREARCFSECAPSIEVDRCAARYACSRHMWRPDIVDDVYACIERQPCEVADPATACLEQVSAQLRPSAMRLDFERAHAKAEQRCPELFSVAPGQSDAVYELLTACIGSNDSCASMSACAAWSLDALVGQVCEGEPIPDELRPGDGA